VQKCEGEAIANNRKGKLIFFYEWDIVLKWTGKLKGGEQEAEGTVNIPNLSEENDVSEVDVSVQLLYLLIAVVYIL
jgi:activator of HSP90 ATPase